MKGPRGDGGHGTEPVAFGRRREDRRARVVRVAAVGDFHCGEKDGGLYRELSGYWAPQQLYFKAGAYIQDNYGPLHEGGRVTFSWLNSLHR